jgi:hypothetical protein
MDEFQQDRSEGMRIVHMQDIDHLTKTYCGRLFYRQKHVTSRFKKCTCKVCWLSICAQYQRVKPGADIVITVPGQSQTKFGG